MPNNLLLIAGSSYHFKVSGLGSDKRHIIVESSSPFVKVTVIKANDKFQEQTLLLEMSKDIKTVIHPLFL
jgi:hypothetical protein